MEMNGINVVLGKDFRMMVLNQADSACFARALTKEQFKAIEPMVRSLMNYSLGVRGSVAYEDADFIKELCRLGMPIDFTPTPAEHVIASALFQKPIPMRGFLSDWLKNQEEYNLARDYFTADEHLQMDTLTFEYEQRMVLMFIALSEGAHYDKRMVGHVYF
jgi:hypothetical protein